MESKLVSEGKLEDTRGEEVGISFGGMVLISEEEEARGFVGWECFVDWESPGEFCN